MGNPVLDRLNQRQPQNPLQMLQQIQKFKQSLNGKDPHAIVQGLLDSGQMTQEQFNQLKQQAEQIVGMFKGF